MLRKHRHKHKHKHKTTSISYGKTKANSKENSFCFVFVTLRGKFVLCYFVYAYMSLVRFTKKKQKNFLLNLLLFCHYSLITRSFMLVLMLISMLMSTDSVDFLFCLLFYLVIMLMLLVRTRL